MVRIETRRKSSTEGFIAVPISKAQLPVIEVYAASAYNMTIEVIGAHMREIQLKDAKATLSAVVDHAVGGEPSVITRHGRKEAVVLSFSDYERLSSIPSLGELLAAFPGDEDDLPKRRSIRARSVEF